MKHILTVKVINIQFSLKVETMSISKWLKRLVEK
nr:MAG TPA: CRISPR-associated protein [Caudoviricetes sp.]